MTAQNQTVAITGAARGIAFELAREHLAVGDRVVALVRNPEAATALTDLAAGADGRLTIHRMDVGDDASVRAGAADAGSGPIDVLYNVAGVSGNSAPEFATADFAQWLDVLSINTLGPARVLQAFLPRLGAGAKVIAVASQVGASNWPYPGYEIYGASKAALSRLMRTIALELTDRGIVVGIVHPGYVQTDMGGANAEITPEESAAGLRKLAAEWTLADSGEYRKWNGEPQPW